MVARIINGKEIAERVKQEVQENITEYRQQGWRAPSLAVILVGNNVASEVYVRNKRRSCDQVGIDSYFISLPESITEQELLAEIDKLNKDPQIDGILVQLPLPVQIKSSNVVSRIDPSKDVDGFHPENIGKLCQKEPELRPCTPFGVMKLLASTGIPLAGLNAVLVGASNIVGRPMALELLLEKVTVTITHTGTKDLADHVRRADIVIVALGKPEFISADWIKPGAIVIDVGINRVDGKLVGDVDFVGASAKAGFITPVPGGVGPMTVAMLMYNTLEAYKKHLVT